MSVKEIEKIFIIVIEYMIFEDIQMNIGSKNSPTLFFDMLHYTTVIYEDSSLCFRLGNRATAVVVPIFPKTLAAPLAREIYLTRAVCQNGSFQSRFEVIYNRPIPFPNDL